MKTVAVYLKHILMCSLMFFVVNLVVAQDYQAKHEVQRGETLSSIAKQYGVTEQMVKEANPQMGDLFYVGLKLNIPVKQESAKKIVNTSIKSNEDIEITDNALVETVGNDEREKWTFTFEIGYGFLDNGGLKGSSAFAYQATIGANYLFDNNFYSGGRIGYNSANMTFSGGKSNVHMIVLPLEVGYVWGGENIKLIPFSGFDFNIGLSGKNKLDDYDDIKMKVGGKLGLALNLGLRLSLGTFNISGKYHLPINNQQKKFFGEDAYPEISIGYGF